MFSPVSFSSRFFATTKLVPRPPSLLLGAIFPYTNHSTSRPYTSGVANNVTWLKKWGRRDMKRRKLVAEHSDSRLRLRMIKKTDFLPEKLQNRARKDLASLPLDSNICQVRNRCIMTDRPRAQFKVCRHKFKKYADAGIAPGVK